MQECRKLTSCPSESWGIDKRHANLKNVHLWKNPSWQETAFKSLKWTSLLGKKLTSGCIFSKAVSGKRTQPVQGKHLAIRSFKNDLASYHGGLCCHWQVLPCSAPTKPSEMLSHSERFQRTSTSVMCHLKHPSRCLVRSLTKSFGHCLH